MGFYYIVFLIFVACALVIWLLKERSVYVLFLATYTHSLLIPFLYTHGIVGKDWAHGLLVLKDTMLLQLFAWCGVTLFTRFRLPRPLKALFVLATYCGFRALVGVVFLSDDWGHLMLRMKAICFPLEIVVVITVLTALHPEFGRRFLRDITYCLSVSAVIALAIFLFAPRDFFLQNANIAEYNADVKGDTENEESFDLGIAGAATMGARAEAFADIASFRAVGTFGDGLTLSFQMAGVVLLLLFYFPKKPLFLLMLAVSSAALIFSLSRSGWLFCVTVGIYVLLRRRQFLPLFILGGLVVALVLVWAPMRQFAVDTMFNATTSSENNDIYHAEGVRWFYTRGFSDPGNIFGKGMSPDIRAIPEIGYAYLLEQFGILAYLSFLWFCFALYRQFNQGETRTDALMLLAQGIPLGILVVMHFSQYPFSFTTFISLWYIVGLALSHHLLPKTSLGREVAPARRQMPSGYISPKPQFS
jgi:hypothetical protein